MVLQDPVFEEAGEMNVMRLLQLFVVVDSSPCDAIPSEGLVTLPDHRISDNGGHVEVSRRGGKCDKATRPLRLGVRDLLQAIIKVNKCSTDLILFL